MIEPNYILSALINGILIGSIYSLVAMGLSLIWGIMEVINFAQGEFMMLGAFTTYWLLALVGIDPLVSIPLSFFIIFVSGMLTQRFVIDRILHASALSQVTVTFALLLMIRYGAETIFGPFTRRVVTDYTGTILRFEAFSVPQIQVVAFGITLLLVVMLYFFLTKTYFGNALRAVSQNRNAALLLGINIKRMYRVAFGIGVGISAVGGTLLSMFHPIYPEMGDFFTLLAFIIVVFGGFGSIFGSYASGLIIGVSESVSALFISPSLKDVVAFLLFVAIILLKPKGLFGK